MEIDESVEECAVRETLEETKIEIRHLEILGVYSSSKTRGLGVVTIVYLAAESRGRAAPGKEALETRWFEPSEIPWGELANQTIAVAVDQWLCSLVTR